MNRKEHILKTMDFQKDKYGNSHLHRAVSNQSCTIDKIEGYLNRFALNDRNMFGETPLHCILMSNCRKLDIIQKMISNGADVHAKDCNGSTALHKAVQNRSCIVKLIGLLTENGANLSDKQFESETPLMVAVQNHHNVEIMENLIFRGCLDICMWYKVRHLTLHIIVSDVRILKLFLKFSAYVGPIPRRLHSIEEDYLGEETIINFSCPNSVCGFASVEGRINSGTDLITALLMYAVKSPSYNLEAVRELLKKGAALYTSNCLNSCALDYALKNPACSVALIQELLTYDIPETIWRPTGGRDSFLHIAASNRKCPAKVMELLLKRDQHRNINTENINNISPLDCAADITQDTDCNLKVVETLLKNGASMLTSKNQFRDVLWKNIQVLGGPNANQVVLECIKLLIKYLFITNNEIEKMNIIYVYPSINKMLARFRWRDNNGYFQELTSFLNECFTEILNIIKLFSPVSRLKDLNISFMNLFNYADEQEFYQKVFFSLVSNQFPVYNTFIINLLQKDVFENYISDVQLYSESEKGKKIYLNFYCMRHLALYLKNEDIFNLYLSLMDQNSSNHSIYVPEDSADLKLDPYDSDSNCDDWGVNISHYTHVCEQSLVTGSCSCSPRKKKACRKLHGFLW